jgi:DNA-binding GntR family transcriptional regulator
LDRWNDLWGEDMASHPPYVRPTSNLTDVVHAALKEAILHCKLPPGSRLDEVKVAGDLRVSRTPVREALQRLAAEGLAVIVPHRGAFVISLSVKDIEELYEMREAMEGHAARLAATRATPVTLVALEQVLQEYAEAVGPDDRDLIVLLDSQFHDGVAQAGQNGRLLQAIRSYREQLRLLRTTSVAIPGRPARSLREMTAVLKALKSRDPDAAEAEMRRHIRSVRDDVVASNLKEEP